MEYKWTRLEPLVKNEGDLSNVVVDLVCGLTATDGEYTAYIDTMHKLSAPDPSAFIPFEDLTLEWATAIAESVAEERGFIDTLDKQIAATRVRPTSKPFSWQQGEE
jgi:hypothetical protein